MARSHCEACAVSHSCPSSLRFGDPDRLHPTSSLPGFRSGSRGWWRCLRRCRCAVSSRDSSPVRRRGPGSYCRRMRRAPWCQQPQAAVVGVHSPGLRRAARRRRAGGGVTPVRISVHCMSRPSSIRRRLASGRPTPAMSLSAWQPACADDAASTMGANTPMVEQATPSNRK